MIHPQLETESDVNNLPPQTSVDCLDAYVAELKNSRHVCWCCCNLWIAAQFWTLSHILMHMSVAVSLVMVHPHSFAQASAYVVLVIGALIGLYGIRHCNPEYIGSYVTIIIFQIAFVSLAGIVTSIGNDGLTILWIMISFIFLWSVAYWWFLGMRKVYRAARKHRYEKHSYLLNGTRGDD